MTTFTKNGIQVCMPDDDEKSRQNMMIAAEFMAAPPKSFSKDSVCVFSTRSGNTKEIVAAAKDYDPSRITRYVYDTATLFHKFYNACRVKCDDESLMQARLSLCLAARTVIANVLDMFKINAPESM